MPGRKPKDITGLTVGVARVIEKAFGKKHGQSVWTCSCNSCGRTFLACYGTLTTAHNRRKTPYSCGCLKKRRIKKEIPVETDEIKSLTIRKPILKSGCERLYAQYQRRALNKNWSFTLSLEAFMTITQENCGYCGDPPKQIYVVNSESRYVYNGIDRIDSSCGYEPNNCLPCCGICNLMKQKHNQTFFIKHIQKIYDNLNKIRN